MKSLPLAFLIYLLPGTQSEVCSCGGEVIQNHCYQLYDLPSYDWVTADETCQNEGGHMAHFTDEDQTKGIQNYLRKVLTLPALIGVTVANAQTQRLALLCPQNKFYDIMDSTLAKEMVSSNYSNSKRCSYITTTDYKISFAPCNLTAQVLCDRPIGQPDYCSVMMNCSSESTTDHWTSDWTKMITTTGKTLTENGLGNGTGGGNGTGNSTTSVTIITTTKDFNDNSTDWDGTTTIPSAGNNGTNVNLTMSTTITPGNNTVPNDSGVNNGTVTAPGGGSGEPGGGIIGEEGGTGSHNATTVSTISHSTPIPSGRTTTSASSEKKCSGLKIFSVCFPWWTLALLLLLLLLLLCCCIYFCLFCGKRKATVQETQPIPMQKIMVTKETQSDMVHSTDPSVIGAVVVPPPKDTAHKETMTDFENEKEIVVERVVEKEIVEVEKVIYEPASIIPLPIPKPHSAHGNKMGEDVDDVMQEIPDFSLPEPKEKPPSPTPFAVIVDRPPIQRAASPAFVPKHREPRRPPDWKFNNKLDEAYAPIPDSDDDDEPDYRFAPSKPGPKFPAVLPLGMAVAAVPHRFAPEKPQKPSEKPSMKRQSPVAKSPTRNKKPKFRPASNFEILKIGTPMSRPVSADGPHMDSGPPLGNPSRKTVSPFKKRVAPRRRSSVPDLQTPDSTASHPSNRRTGSPGRSSQRSRSRNAESPQRRGKSNGVSSRPTKRGSVPRSTPLMNFPSSASPIDPSMLAANGKLGGVAGDKSRDTGWKPWAKTAKTFSDRPVFLDYD